MEATEKLHWVPDRGPEDDYCRRGHRDADERIQSHRGWQSERLADGLSPLIFRKTREVGDVQGNRGPEADCGVERGNQELEKFSGVLEA